MKSQKQKIKTNITTRYQLANPWIGIPLEQRLIEAEVINLEDNHIITDLGNGYCTIEPIDRTKVFK
jgi:hypothetical protein